MQRNRDPDHHGNPGIHKSLNNRSPHIIAFELHNPTLGQHHSLRLPVAGLVSSFARTRPSFLQHIVLEAPADDP